MVELPIITLDMSKKNKVYSIEYPAFAGEDNVYVVRLKPDGYDWSNKAATISCALKDSRAGYTSDVLTVDDGVVLWNAPAEALKPGTNQLQINIYGTVGEFREISPIVEWVLGKALPGTEPIPDDVDIIEGLMVQVSTAVASLDDVRTVCVDSALTADEKAEAATQVLAQTTEQLQQLLTAIGDIICPLGVDKKVPIENIPATAMSITIPITSEDELVTLDAQRNDRAAIIEVVAGKETIVKTWELMGDDASVLGDWKLCGTDYAVQAAYAIQASASTNSLMWGGRARWDGTLAEYEALPATDTNTDYFYTE